MGDVCFFRGVAIGGFGGDGHGTLGAAGGGTRRGAGEGWGWVSGRTMAWKGGSLSAAVVTDLRVARDAWEEGRGGRGLGER